MLTHWALAALHSSQPCEHGELLLRTHWCSPLLAWNALCLCPLCSQHTHPSVFGGGVSLSSRLWSVSSDLPILPTPLPGQHSVLTAHGGSVRRSRRSSWAGTSVRPFIVSVHDSGEEHSAGIPKEGVPTVCLHFCYSLMDFVAVQPARLCCHTSILPTSLQLCCCVLPSYHTGVCSALLCCTRPCSVQRGLP